MASPSPRSHAKRLEEDNYNLRLQVSKLQVSMLAWGCHCAGVAQRV